jgi:spore coat protein U-like protein
MLGLAAACAGLTAWPGEAATSRQFIVNATIVNGCAITQAAGSWGRIDFGTTSGVATGTLDANLLLSGSSGLTIECTPGTAATLSADNGNNAASGQRRMVQAGVTPGVAYSLFANGSTTPWTTQLIGLDFPANFTRRTIPVKGRAILPGTLRAGKYVDTVRITLAW